MAEQKQHIVRKRYYIRGDIQGRYLFAIIVSAIIPVFLVAGCLYYLMAEMMAQELAFPDAIYAHLVPVLKKIGYIMLIGLPIIFLLILFWGIIISHKFAGPIHRLEEDLAKILGGDLSVRIRFRKRDRLENLALQLNKLLEEFSRCKKGG